MRRVKSHILVLASLGALAAMLVGCGGPEPDEANTPANAQTISNGQYLDDLDKEGEEGGGGGAGSEAPPPGGGEPPAAGDDPAVAAGADFYKTTCTTCHGENGQAGPIGPEIAGKGFDEAKIRNTLVNGQNAMPAGLAQGEDLENVIKYVLSLQ